MSSPILPGVLLLGLLGLPSAQETGVSVHDLHATMLHVLGLDHKRLTYRSQARDFRLTDVEGVVVERLLA